MISRRKKNFLLQKIGDRNKKDFPLNTTKKWSGIEGGGYFNTIGWLFCTHLKFKIFLSPHHLFAAHLSEVPLLCDIFGHRHSLEKK